MPETSQTNIGDTTAVTGTIWDKITPTANSWEGTIIPYIFRIKLDDNINYTNPRTGENHVWLNTNGAKHLESYLNINDSTTSFFTIPVNAQILLEDANLAINEYMRYKLENSPKGKEESAVEFNKWEVHINLDDGMLFHLEQKK